MKVYFKNYFVGAAILLATFFSACKKNEVAPTPPVVVPPVVTPPVNTPPPTLASIKAGLVDKNATDETAAMFYNMKVLAKTNIMFGHQDDTKRGYKWNEEANRSDVYDVTGTYPSVFGWDFLDIASFQRNSWFDNEANIIRKLAADAYRRGAINTFSWHYWNPILSKSNGQDGVANGLNASFYYKDAPSPAVSRILPGGDYNDVYKKSLDRIADFVSSLKADDGKLIPIVFRPFHELDGDWFWWGAPYCTAQEYKDLYRFTVTYLRDTKGLHNILFAFSPDRNYSTADQYMARYPGDEYVDILGSDNYYDLKTASGITTTSNKLKILSDYAIKNNKIAALTETGLENISQNDWYTQVLLKAMTQQKLELSYALAWTNSDNTVWTPYKGHPAVADFINFKNNSNITFLDKLPKMYQLK